MILSSLAKFLTTPGVVWHQDQVSCDTKCRVASCKYRIPHGSFQGDQSEGGS